MGKVYNNNIKTDAGFNYHSPQPLDDRAVVAEYSDLNSLIVAKNMAYEGMEVYVIEKSKSYKLINGVWKPMATESYVNERIGDIQINGGDNSPLILSLKQDATTKEYQIVDSAGEQVSFDEIFTEAQSRPIYCRGKDGFSLLPLAILEPSMIMFIGMPHGAGIINYCEIQYDGESGNVLVIERPLIVPEMSDNLDEGTYLGSAPSLQYLEQYVRNNSSSAWADIHIVGYAWGSIRGSSELDDLQPGHIYRLVVSPNPADTSSAGYGWLFTLYMDSGEHNHGQILIDLDGQILSRYMVASDWTEWQPIGNGGNSEITVDTELNSESTNPVQNKAVASGLGALRDEIIEGVEIGERAIREEVARTYATKEEVTQENFIKCNYEDIDSITTAGKYLVSCPDADLPMVRGDAFLFVSDVIANGFEVHQFLIGAYGTTAKRSGKHFISLDGPSVIRWSEWQTYATKEEIGDPISDENIEKLENMPEIKFIQSPNDENAVKLRDLDSGVYVLDGYFGWNHTIKLPLLNTLTVIDRRSEQSKIRFLDNSDIDSLILSDTEILGSEKVATHSWVTTQIGNVETALSVEIIDDVLFLKQGG